MNAELAKFLEVLVKSEYLESKKYNQRPSLRNMAPIFREISAYLDGCNYEVLENKDQFARCVSLFHSSDKQFCSLVQSSLLEGLGRAQEIVKKDGLLALVEETKSLERHSEYLADEIYFRNCQNQKRNSEELVHSDTGRQGIVVVDESGIPMPEVYGWMKEGKMPFCGLNGSVIGYFHPTRLALRTPES